MGIGARLGGALGVGDPNQVPVAGKTSFEP